MKIPITNDVQGQNIIGGLDEEYVHRLLDEDLYGLAPAYTKDEDGKIIIHWLTFIAKPKAFNLKRTEVKTMNVERKITRTYTSFEDIASDMNSAMENNDEEISCLKNLKITLTIEGDDLESE